MADNVIQQLNQLDPPTSTAHAKDVIPAPITPVQEPCLNVKQYIDSTVKRSFLITAIMVFVTIIIMMGFTLFVVNQHSIEAKKSNFGEIARARGELLEQIQAERDQVLRLQQAMLIYSESIDNITDKIGKMEKKIEAQKVVSVVVTEPAADKIVTITEKPQEKRLDDRTIVLPTPVKKSLWSKLAFWK